MSLFQVSFLLLPEKSISTNGASLLEILQHPAHAYRAFELPSTYADEVEAILPLKKSWAEELEIWGDEEADDFSIWRNGGNIESIEVRFDVRRLDDRLMSKILDLAVTWGCSLVERRHGTVCSISVRELRTLITGHAHNRAVKDPEVWLPFLAKEVRKQDSTPDRPHEGDRN